jgi:hypothetical protein
MRIRNTVMHSCSPIPVIAGYLNVDATSRHTAGLFFKKYDADREEDQRVRQLVCIPTSGISQKFKQMLQCPFWHGPIKLKGLQ